MHETGYHKLADPAHWESIQQSQSFHPSVPAEKHWLGEGVYFFLDPNGIKWATRWPLDGSQRDGSQEGIVIASIDASEALDFRDLKVMENVRKTVALIRGAVAKQYKNYSDGAALTLLFKKGLIRPPTCIIANFDRSIKPGLWEGSRMITKPQYCLPPYSGTTQIQACVRKQEIIKNLSVFTEMTAL